MVVGIPGYDFPSKPAESFEAKPLNNVGKSARRGELQLSRGTLWPLLRRSSCRRGRPWFIFSSEYMAEIDEPG